MKLYTRTEINKGYIPSDKQHLKIKDDLIPFEIFGLSNFLDKENYEEFEFEYNRDKNNKLSREILIKQLIQTIIQSNTYKEIEEEGYHKYLYLNINSDGVDCFISR